MIEQNLQPLPKWSRIALFWGAALLLYIIMMLIPYPHIPDLLFGFGMIGILGGLYGKPRLKTFLRPMKRGKKRMFFLLLFLSYVAAYTPAILLFLFGFSGNAHPASQSLPDYSIPQFLLYLLVTFFGMIGEELLIAVFTFPLWGWLKAKGMRSSRAFLISAILGSLIFGLFHLPTYQWNWLQCILIIGLARLPFTYAWREMDSLWGGILVHYLFDILLFTLVYWGSSLGVAY